MLNLCAKKILTVRAEAERNGVWPRIRQKSPKKIDCKGRCLCVQPAKKSPRTAGVARKMANLKNID
jgi:hypothetical protein